MAFYFLPKEYSRLYGYIISEDTVCRGENMTCDTIIIDVKKPKS
ncbi:protein of unknown function [Vibrio tapetis subsp. tapetis]|uniref:Uncharacterized protein n=1 Tax=Vibrio tapetis subsp. tapetis TaxID=1671868 RepID=A0A2N8ZFR1_9VIBR|nr:protein of unknown function [Vibrio tapetis subsp. tapetis]